MARRVLITGGAGFLGSHLADHLLREGHDVRVLDALVAQVHGPDAERPEFLDPEVELQLGDVRDPRAVARALDGVDAVVHFAAAVGVGQSMYECDAYTDVNCRGTAVLLEHAVKSGVRKVLVASSMSVYGEGAYATGDGERCAFQGRSAEQLRRGEWEPVDAHGERLRPLPTGEHEPADPASVYALTKLYQERFCLTLGAAYRVPTVALRFFNAYGTRQSLSNPYTGVLAIFASRLLRDLPLQIYEDGQQLRDFVSVHDIARACVRALDTDAADGQVLNIGSGQPRTVRDVAAVMAKALDREHIEPEVLGKYRSGDIRHCYADISLAQRLLGYRPRVAFADGVGELAGWLAGRMPAVAESATVELEQRGLTT